MASMKGFGGDIRVPVQPKNELIKSVKKAAQKQQDDRYEQRSKYMAGDLEKGEDFFSKFYDTPEMADIIERRKAFANGLSDPEFAVLRDRGTRDLNTAMQTGLRQLKGLQASSGIRGGAAGAQGLRLLADINSQKQRLASDLAANDIAIRRQGLDDYSDLMTGLASGKASSALGYAGLGVANRTAVDQLQLGRDFLNAQYGNPGWWSPGHTAAANKVGGAMGAAGNFVSNGSSPGGALGTLFNYGKGGAQVGQLFGGSKSSVNWSPKFGGGGGFGFGG